MIEPKDLAIWIVIMLGILSFSFSLYNSMNLAKNHGLSEEFLDSFQEEFTQEWFDNAYDLKLIRGDPDVTENFYDYCNEKELGDLIRSLNNTITHLEEIISETQIDISKHLEVKTVLPEGVVLTKT